MDDDVERVVSHYLREGAEQSGEVSLRSRVQDNSFSFTKLRFVDSKGDVASAFDVREPIVLHIEYEAKGRIADLELTLRVYNSYGIPIFSTNRSGSLAAGVSPGKYVSILKIPAAFLCPGSYSVDVAAHIPNVQVLCDLQSVAVFSVEETGNNMAVYRG